MSIFFQEGVEGKNMADEEEKEQEQQQHKADEAEPGPGEVIIHHPADEGKGK